MRYGGDDPNPLQLTTDPGTAGDVAAAWKITALAKVGFLELETYPMVGASDPHRQCGACLPVINRTCGRCNEV